MRGKNFNILGILFLFGIILLSMGFVGAADLNTTFVTPAANANVTGTVSFSATVWGNSTHSNTTNITFRWWNETLHNWAIICANSTTGLLSYTCSVATTALPDNTTEIFNANATNATATASNSTNVTVLAVDNTAPVIHLLTYTNRTQSDSTLPININVSDATSGIYSKSACLLNVNGTNITVTISSGWCNTTLNIVGTTEGNQTINVYVNDSANVYGVNNSYEVFFDGTGPQVDLTLASSTKESLTLNIGLTDTYTATSSCTVDRSGATVTGTTSLTESGLSCATAYTYIVTCTDSAGNTGSATESFSTNTCGGGAAAGGGGGAQAQKANAWTTITPGAATIMKDFDAEIGVKQIEITVNNEAQNVKITVTKEAGKPAAVSVAKSGKVYQYLQINAENLADKLDKATVQFRVEKTWATTNSVDKNKVVVSKFDSASSKWNELTTTYVSEDSTYYYYDVEVTSFSYFAISEKSLTGDSGTDTGETGTTGGSSLTWLWVLIALVILVVIGVIIGKRKQ